MGNKRRISRRPRMAVSLYPLTRDARGVSSNHGLFVSGIQVQSRLLVLLVVQQQGEGHDGGRGAPFDRLASRQRLSRTRTHGGRAPAAARIRAQSRLLCREEGILGLRRNQWTLAET